MGDTSADFMGTPIAQLTGGANTRSGAGGGGAEATATPATYADVASQLREDLARDAEKHAEAQAELLARPPHVSAPPPQPQIAPRHRPQAPTPPPAAPTPTRGVVADGLRDRRAWFVALLTMCALYAGHQKARAVLPARCFDTMSGQLNIVGVVGLGVLFGVLYKAFDLLQRVDGN